MKATYKKHTLQFLCPAGTSRGVYTTKDSWYLFLSDGEYTSVGECSLLSDLSIDDRPDFEDRLNSVCEEINSGIFNFENMLYEFPAIQFGLETALLDLQNGGRHILYPSLFTTGEKGITTNGLIWMGDFDYMKKQISQKLDIGFSCIKLKIGAIDWEHERQLITEMRKQFSESDLTIRVDANGAYNKEKAIRVLHNLSALKVHSIEQPIKAGDWATMAELCSLTPVPIALDEELIGIQHRQDKLEMLEIIHPQYIILKPSLIGGFKSAEQWIDLAQNDNIGWWATSALESNIGLNAIAQWVYSQDVTMPQGLGTGMLFANNIDSPLTMRGEKLHYKPTERWGI